MLRGYCVAFRQTPPPLGEHNGRRTHVVPPSSDRAMYSLYGGPQERSPPTGSLGVHRKNGTYTRCGCDELAPPCDLSTMTGPATDKVGSTGSGHCVGTLSPIGPVVG